VKSRLVLSLGLSIGAVGVEPGLIRTAHETGEITLVCGHDALAVGQSGLGWVTSDLPVQVLSLVGLAFLLFLAGLVVELGRLRGRAAPTGRTGCGTIETALWGPGQARRYHRTDPCPGAVLLLIGFVALAERFGLQTILGAFLAGVILRIVDPEATATHPHFRLKLEGIGYGFLIPVFFVSSGVEFNLSALLSSASTMVRVPIFLLALLFVRGMPALLYRHVLGNRRSIAAGLLFAGQNPR